MGDDIILVEKKVECLTYRGAPGKSAPEKKSEGRTRSLRPPNRVLKGPSLFKVAEKRLSRRQEGGRPFSRGWGGGEPGTLKLAREERKTLGELETTPTLR